MSNYWKSFFESYRLVDIKSDTDLRFQVGKSVGGKAISDSEFKGIVDRIARAIDLNAHDRLLDLCCGNGVITHELAARCKSVLGIDFSQPYIENARTFKSADNIEYVCDDVTNFTKAMHEHKFLPTKVLMQGSLAYLTTEQFASLLQALKDVAPDFGSFLVSAVPDQSRRHLFHNTLRRKIAWFYYSIVLKRDRGVGRWWTKKEIEDICKAHELQVFFDQPVSGLCYRMDFVIRPNLPTVQTTPSIRLEH